MVVCLGAWLQESRISSGKRSAYRIILGMVQCSKFSVQRWFVVFCFKTTLNLEP